MQHHNSIRATLVRLTCGVVLACGHAVAVAQDGLALDRPDVLSPSGTLTEPNEGFVIGIDIDQLAGERLAGDGFVILLEPPRPVSDALFGNGFEAQ